MPAIFYVLLGMLVAVSLASAAYALIAIFSIGKFRLQTQASSAFRPPVTVLKPVCGLDTGLYENLRSFCLQDYPAYQIVFGVIDAADPAVTVIERLRGEFPQIDMDLIIDKTVTGPNPKASNLENMYHAAKHAYLVIADSDIVVGPHYLASVVEPYEDPKVGVVTCLYKGISAGGLASLLSCMFINDWFIPSVLVSARMRELRFGLGATIAVRRDVLDRIGGFKTLSKYLADDHMLGRLVSEQGYKVVLSDYVVETVVHEQNLPSLFRHELRWARTVNSVEPMGHLFSFIMYGVPLAFFSALMAHLTLNWGALGLMMVVMAVFLRVCMHVSVRRKLALDSKNCSLWLIPVRDILSFVVWAVSFFSKKINWKGSPYTVNSGGLVFVTEKFEK